MTCPMSNRFTTDSSPSRAIFTMVVKLGWSLPATRSSPLAKTAMLDDSPSPVSVKMRLILDASLLPRVVHGVEVENHVLLVGAAAISHERVTRQHLHAPVAGLGIVGVR